MDVRDEYRREFNGHASEIYANFRRKVDEVRRNDMLSNKAKHEQIAQLDNDRRHAVDVLQASAQIWIQRRREEKEKEYTAARLGDVESRRRLLGDAVYVDIIRRNLEQMTPQEIAQAYKDTPSEWEKAILAEYGVLLLRGQSKTDPAAYMAMRELQEEDAIAPIARDVKILENGADMIGELDVAAQAERMAVTFGIDPEAMAQTLSGV